MSREHFPRSTESGGACALDRSLWATTHPCAGWPTTQAGEELQGRIIVGGASLALSGRLNSARPQC